MTYWCDENLIVRISGPEGEREVALDQPLALIGKHPRAHVVLEGEGVRKRSLLLLAMEQGIYCAYLDYAEVGPEELGRWLKDDEAIRLGPYTLTARVSSGTPLAGPDWNPQSIRSAPPIPVMHVYCGGLLKDRRRIRYPLTMIGRRPQCSLRLRGEVVSSYHCLLYWCDRRLWCIDLISSNGTRIGDEEVTCRELQLSEKVEVGEFSLIYYRWSPRRLTPGTIGQEAAAAHDELEVAFDASLEALDDETDEGGSVLGTSAAAVQREMQALAANREQEEQQSATIAAQEATIQRLNEELQAERAANAQCSEQWRLERERLASEMAKEREALVALRQTLEAERLNLSKRVIDQAKLVERLESELAAARQAAAKARADVAVPVVVASNEDSGSNVVAEERPSEAAPEEKPLSMFSAEPGVEAEEELAAAGQSPLMSPVTEWTDLADELQPAELQPATMAHESDDDAASKTDLALIVQNPNEAEDEQREQEQVLAASEPEGAEEGLPKVQVAASQGRRSTAKKEELTSFVSGRLGDIERSRRAQVLLVWTAVSVAVLATAAVAFGLWFWLK